MDFGYHLTEGENSWQRPTYKIPNSKSQEPCFDFPTLIHVLQLSNHKKTKNQKPKFQNSFPEVFGRVILIRRKRRNERLKKHRGW